MIDGKSASEIFDSIRQHITSGKLAKGETLPPVRELAVQLDVNRNTVAAAYKRLVTVSYTHLTLPQWHRRQRDTPACRTGRWQPTLTVGRPLQRKSCSG